MKKLVLMLAVAFSVSLVSCGGNNEAAQTEEVPAVEEVAVEEVAVVTDSVEAPVDSVAPEAAPVAE